MSEVERKTVRKTVQYRPNDNDRIHIGQMAVIMEPIDHPSDLVSNGDPVFTSMVCDYNKDTGEIFTINTRYIPCD